MKRILKKLTSGGGAVLLIISILLNSISVSAISFNLGGEEVEEEQTESDIQVMSADSTVIASGNCGAYANYSTQYVPTNKCTWELTDDGVLTISGTGSMFSNYYAYNSFGYNLYNNSKPRPGWYNYRSSITSVVITEGVTSIGNYSFLDCSKIQSVTVSDTVTTIGYGAFYNCSSMTNINIGSNVKYINGGAFYFCNSLTNVELPDSVQSLGTGCFQFCTSLQRIKLSNSITSVPNDCFRYCYKLIDIVLPEGIKSIGSYAFEDLASDVSDSNTSWTDNRQFIIPEGVTTISEGAFQSAKLSSIVIPSTLTTIGDYAFSKCFGTGGNKSISVGGVNRNVYGLYGTKFIVSADDEHWSTDDTGYILFTKDKDKIISYNKPTVENNIDISQKTYELPDTVQKIAGGAFRSRAELQYVNGNNTITELGKGAFMYCYSLKEVIDLSGVTNIPDLCFYQCLHLTKVEIPSNVVSIYEDAFNGCTSINNLILDEGMGSYNGIGTNAFYGCTGITSVTIPSSCKSIGKQAFYGCSKNSSITLKDGLKTINGSAFENNPLIERIEVPKSVTSIGVKALRCNNTVYINVDDENQKYCDIDGVLYTKDLKTLEQFTRNGSTVAYKTPDETVNIQDYAFYNSDINSIDLSNVESIGDYAFSKCNNITLVEIPDSCESIYGGAFSNMSNLEYVYIGSGIRTLHNYSDNVFNNCPKLNEVEIDSADIISGKPWGVSSDKITFLRELVIDYDKVDMIYKAEDIKPADTALVLRRIDGSADDIFIDYNRSIKYTNNKNAGTAHVNVTTSGSAVIDEDFTIKPRPDSMLTVFELPSVAFTGNQIKPDANVEITRHESDANQVEPKFKMKWNSGLYSASITKGRNVEYRLKGTNSWSTSSSYYPSYDWNAEDAKIMQYRIKGTPTIYPGPIHEVVNTMSYLQYNFDIDENGDIVGGKAVTGVNASGSDPVKIPDRVTEIGNNAMITEGLWLVDTGKNLEKIGDGAFSYFWYDDTRSALEFGNKLKTIGSNAFRGIYVPGIYIDVPRGSISGEPWGYEEGYDEEWHDTYPHLPIVYKDDYTWDGTVITGWSDTAVDKSTLIVPSYCTGIGANAFKGCTELKNIVPVGSFYYNYGYVNYSQPLTIGESAFEDCANLTGSLGAKSILMYTKDIGAKAFKNTKITSATVYGCNIGNEAFANCTKLKGVNILTSGSGSSGTNIGTKAFSGCTSLSSFSVNRYNNIQGVGDNAFENTSISTFTLTSIKGNIGNDIFNNVPTLTNVSITLSDKNATISENAFRGYTGVLTVNLNGASETNKPWGYTGDNITVTN